MSRFDFHANATGVGGVLTSGGGRTIVPSLASTNLAKSGGEGEASTGEYKQHGMSFASIRSHVFGLEEGGIFYTTASVDITNFAVYDPFNKEERLRIASMTALMKSTRDPALPDSRFSVTLTYGVITVDGVVTHPEVDIALCNAPTFGDVSTTLTGRLSEYATIFGVTQGAITTALAAPAARIGGALVKGFGPSPTAPLSLVGCRLPIPGYGVLHFAEFKFQPGYRNVSLLRLSPQSTSAAGFDGPVGSGGDLTLGAVEGNGSPPF